AYDMVPAGRKLLHPVHAVCHACFSTRQHVDRRRHARGARPWHAVLELGELTQSRLGRIRVQATLGGDGRTIPEIRSIICRGGEAEDVGATRNRGKFPLLLCMAIRRALSYGSQDRNVPSTNASSGARGRKTFGTCLAPTTIMRSIDA